MRTQHPLLNPKKASCSKILILNRRSMSKQSIFIRFCACLKGTDKFVPVCQKSQRVKKESPITIDIVLLRMGGRLCPPGRVQLILRKAAAHTHALPVSV